MEPSKKAVIYERVSTREQAEQGYSIESQSKLLKDYARNHNFEIAREFTDVESAKGAGRTQFTEMLRFLRSSPSVKTILCEKTDRLYRNFHDYIDLDVDQGELTIILVKENTILNKDSRSHEKLVQGFKVLMAKNYIDNLKEETTKGLLEKAEQGEFPNRAPVGYKNNKETHKIEIDPAMAPVVRRVFELYATGEYSLLTLAQKIAEEGFRARGGRKFHTSEMAFMLSNPIYYGDFRWRKRHFKGIHEHIITRDLFDAAQKAMRRFNKPRVTKNEFVFRGLLTCGKCGCSYTAEKKKKARYIYYHCTSARGHCSNSYLREEYVDEKIADILKAVQIDKDVLDYLIDGLKQSHADEKAYHDRAVITLHQTYQKLQEKLDKAYTDKLDGVISAEFWEKQSALWRREQEDARNAIVRHESANQSYFETGTQLLELAGLAYDIYKVRSLSERRSLASFMVSNFRVEGKNLYPTYKKPFDLLAKGLLCPNHLRD